MSFEFLPNYEYTLFYYTDINNQQNSILPSQINSEFNVNISQNTYFYIQYTDDNYILTTSNIVYVSLTVPILNVLSYTDGKLKMNTIFDGSCNALYKNNNIVSDTVDVNNITVDASSGDTFVYGITPSILSNSIYIPITPIAKLNCVIKNDNNGTYNINTIVHYNGLILSGKTQFIITDNNDILIKVVNVTQHIQFISIQTNTNNILYIKTRITYDSTYIESQSIAIVK
jgi:hypothetical protein